MEANTVDTDAGAAPGRDEGIDDATGVVVDTAAGAAAGAATGARVDIFGKLAIMADISSTAFDSTVVLVAEMGAFETLDATPSIPDVDTLVVDVELLLGVVDVKLVAAELELILPKDVLPPLCEKLERLE